MNLDQNDIYCKKLALIHTAKRCFERGLQSNAGGNLSVRLADPRYLVIKPSGVGFNECSHDNLMIANIDGEVVAGHLKPSKDLGFHAGIYRIRPDVAAIVHVHSPAAVGWSTRGEAIPCLSVQAQEKVRGRIPLIPLAAGGKAQSAEEINPVLQDSSINAALLANHGTIGVGATLLEAQYIVEIIEETAQVACLHKQLGME